MEEVLVHAFGAARVRARQCEKRRSPRNSRRCTRRRCSERIGKSISVLAFWKRLDDIGEAAGSGEIGDLARDKLHFGITATPRKGMTATLRGRYIGERPTVESNPVRRVPSYLTFDAFLRYDGLFAKGLGISLSATNLTDENYAHPGVRDANAGIDPGSFDDQGLWHGSQGFYNSLLPQPGRALLLSVHLSM